MPTVLNVGQCNPDHASITRLLTETFDATVSIAAANSHEEALAKAKEGAIDLILINRIYDATGTEGLKTIEELKGDQETSSIPVMLVSNFDDAQDAAVQLGALPGFGKAALAEEETLEKLRNVLQA